MRRNILALLRTFLFAAFVPAISLSLVACEPESGDDGGGTVTPSVTPEVSVPDGYVNYFIEDLSFSREAGEVKVAFQINVDWSMEVIAPEGTSSSWLSVEPASGAAGLHKILVRVTANDTYESRSAKLHLMCGNSKVAEIAVTQDCEYAVLLSREDYNVSYEATTIDVELKSNVDFEYQILCSWVRESTNATRGLATHNLVFEVDGNDRWGKDREARIIFRNSEYAVADTLTLVQEGKPIPEGAVDLGLSVLWASCNVGADVPEDYGSYFAWGETEEKGSYTMATYKYVRDLDGDGEYYDDDANWINIGSNISGTSYDVAHVKWGGSWRMPTSDEIKELFNNCHWEWTSQNGVKGIKFFGLYDSTIFLPAAGHRFEEEVYDRGSKYVKYWSGTLDENNSCEAYGLYFYWSSWGWKYGCHSSFRYNGFPVRPVTE